MRLLSLLAHEANKRTRPRRDGGIRVASEKRRPAGRRFSGLCDAVGVSARGLRPGAAAVVRAKLTLGALPVLLLVSGVVALRDLVRAAADRLVVGLLRFHARTPSVVGGFPVTGCHGAKRLRAPIASLGTTDGRDDEPFSPEAGLG